MSERGRSSAVIPDVEARPLRAIWSVVVIAAALLLYGVFEPGAVLSDPVARTVWIVVAALTTVGLAATLLRGRLTLTDGVMTKRAFRTTRVDLTDLAAIHTRGDRPWQTNYTGVVRFEDREGGAVEVPLVSGAWTPPRPLWQALGVAIENSGLPMSGIVGAQIEGYIGRSLQVDDANREALLRCRDQVRRGTATPHTSAAGADTAQQLLMGASSLAFLVVLAAAGGAFPPAARAVVYAVAGAICATLAGLIVWRRREHLELRQDAVLTRRRSRVALPELASVELVPDRPYLQTTAEGSRPTGRRSPSLDLQDAAGRSLTLHLGGRWQAPVPILRYVLAAAEERGVPLSEHARYELLYYLGLTGRLRYPIHGRPSS